MAAQQIREATRIRIANSPPTSTDTNESDPIWPPQFDVVKENRSWRRGGGQLSALASLPCDLGSRNDYSAGQLAVTHTLQKGHICFGRPSKRTEYPQKPDRSTNSDWLEEALTIDQLNPSNGNQATSADEGGETHV